NEKELEYTCQVCRINKPRKWRRLSETASKKYNNENTKLEVGDCLCNSCYMTYISNPNNPNHSNSQRCNRLKEIGRQMYHNNIELLSNYNIISSPSNNIKFKKIILEIDGLDYDFDFELEDINNISIIQDAVVYACDKAIISRESYRMLTNIYPDLESNNSRVGTSFINENTNIESVGLYDGDGAYRSIRSILNILIPPLKCSSTF
ncbi:11825_t:CDS:2, partial [Entrophospora sp. SA101]